MTRRQGFIGLDINPAWNEARAEARRNATAGRIALVIGVACWVAFWFALSAAFVAQTPEVSDISDLLSGESTSVVAGCSRSPGFTGPLVAQSR